MGVWASVHALSRKKLHRPHLIEEDERPDQLSFRVGHGVAHGKAAA